MEVSGVSQGRLNLNTNTGMEETEVKVTNVSDKKSIDVNGRIITEKEVSKAVEKLNKLFEDKTTHVQYEVYGKMRSITIKILDDKTNEVIKEIPPKKLIDMVDRLCEIAGVLVDEKA
ncbi:MAG: flagellar protein FlaG [Solirubrobacterales bacterium]